MPLRSTKGVGNTSVHGSLVEYRLRKDVDARCDHWSNSSEPSRHIDEAFADVADARLAIVIDYHFVGKLEFRYLLS